MKTISLIFIMIGSVAILGCAASVENSSEPQTATTSIEDTLWSLVALYDDLVTLGPRQSNLTLDLDSGTKSASGSSGVNLFSGGYEIRGDKLTLGPLGVTRRAGLPEAMKFEQRYLEALSQVTAWKIDNGELGLFADGELVARFEPAPAAKITGTATFRERLALGPEAVFTAILEDTSRADAKAEVLGTTRLAPAGNPPYRFEIAYDPGKIDERHTYAVRATITAKGKLLFTSDTHHPVLTRGAGSTVDILLKRVSSK